MGAKPEIERKYLIERPSDEFLASLPHTEILQTYLICETEGTTERVRKRGLDGKFAYTHTKKARISLMSAMEDEAEISEEEYARLLLRANGRLTPISKTRYLLTEGGFTFEIDVYPFWNRQAVMEIELPNENTAFPLPGKIRILREVTGNRAYSNAALSREIPPEDE